MNELIVIWTSNNSDIVNISITLESNNQSTELVNVDCYKKWASIMVPDAEADYTIRVMEINKCRQSFSSEKYHYNGSDFATPSCNTTGPHNSTGGSPKGSGGKGLVYNS